MRNPFADEYWTIGEGFSAIGIWESPEPNARMAADLFCSLCFGGMVCAVIGSVAVYHLCFSKLAQNSLVSLIELMETRLGLPMDWPLSDVANCFDLLVTSVIFSWLMLDT